MLEQAKWLVQIPILIALFFMLRHILREWKQGRKQKKEEDEYWANWNSAENVQQRNEVREAEIEKDRKRREQKQKIAHIINAINYLSETDSEQINNIMGKIIEYRSDDKMDMYKLLSAAKHLPELRGKIANLIVDSL